MRKYVAILLSVSMLGLAVPVFAADAGAKNECLLEMKNCANQVDTLQQQVKKLNAEIKKGTKVYSPEDLKKLNMKIQEANDMIKALMKP